MVQDFFHQQYDLISKDSNKYRGIHGHSAKEDNLETIGNHWKSTDHIGVEPFMRFQSCQKPTRVQSPICCNIRINIIIIHNAVCLRTYKFQKKGHVHAIFARTDRQNVEDFNSRILSRKCKHGEFMCFFSPMEAGLLIEICDTFRPSVIHYVHHMIYHHMNINITFTDMGGPP